jgi:hypothetical protein
LGAQSLHQTGQVLLPEADVNAPETISGLEMGINGSTFFKQSFELKIKGDLIPEAAAEEIIGGAPNPVRPPQCRGRPQRESRLQADQGIPHCPAPDQF